MLIRKIRAVFALALFFIILLIIFPWTIRELYIQEKRYRLFEVLKKAVTHSGAMGYYANFTKNIFIDLTCFDYREDYEGSKLLGEKIMSRDIMETIEHEDLHKAIEKSNDHWAIDRMMKMEY